MFTITAFIDKSMMLDKIMKTTWVLPFRMVLLSFVGFCGSAKRKSQ
jgi:hypothetical protein